MEAATGGFLGREAQGCFPAAEATIWIIYKYLGFEAEKWLKFVIKIVKKFFKKNLQKNRQKIGQKIGREAQGCFPAAEAKIWIIYKDFGFKAEKCFKSSYLKIWFFV